MNKLTIVIPILNEAKNLQELAKSVHAALNPVLRDYKIVFVDDHSTDNSAEVLSKLSKIYPVRVITKKGPVGKAFSILEGTEVSDSEFIVMLDGDL